MTNDRMRIAHHEAGHAVVAWLSGIAVESITLLDDRSGRADLRFSTLEQIRAANPGAPEFVATVRGLVANYFAGWLAESKFLGRPARLASLAVDMAHVEYVMQRAYEMKSLGNYTDVLVAIEIETSEILNEPAVWSAIERVAREAADRGTIDRLGFEALMREHHMKQRRS